MCFCFCFFSLMKLPVSIFIFYFIVVMKFADIVAVIIDDIDNDCFLMMTISWLFLNIGRYAVFSFSPAPPACLPRQKQCVV